MEEISPFAVSFEFRVFFKNHLVDGLFSIFFIGTLFCSILDTFFFLHLNILKGFIFPRLPIPKAILSISIDTPAGLDPGTHQFLPITVHILHLSLRTRLVLVRQHR
jgi:hypothetical protein